MAPLQEEVEHRAAEVLPNLARSQETEGHNVPEQSDPLAVGCDDARDRGHLVLFGPGRPQLLPFRLADASFAHLQVLHLGGQASACRHVLDALEHLEASLDHRLCRGHEGADAVPPHDGSLFLQKAQRLAQCWPRDSELLGQLDLGGQTLARPIATAAHQLSERFASLHIQRPLIDA